MIKTKVVMANKTFWVKTYAARLARSKTKSAFPNFMPKTRSVFPANRWSQFVLTPRFEFFFIFSQKLTKAVVEEKNRAGNLRIAVPKPRDQKQPDQDDRVGVSQNAPKCASRRLQQQ